MEEDDADDVRRVEAAAFGAWLNEARGRESELAPRTRTNVLVLREMDPQGCFVAEDEGDVVGFIFSRTWGSVGWFGTFGVMREHQGLGIGQRLMAASLTYLLRDPDRTIGLETMPDSPKNLGLYLKHRFRIRKLTLKLSRTLASSAAGELVLPRWSDVDDETRTRWLADLREATDCIHPGLDYSKEILSTARHDLGEILVLVEGGRAVGMAVVRLVAIREKEHTRRAAAQPVVLRPDHADEGTLRALLEAGESLARAHGKREIRLPVNARHRWALDQALQLGYRVEGASVRMVLAGTDEGLATDRHVHLSRWAA